jgi:two-component system, NtrC family, sensor kinase
MINKNSPKNALYEISKEIEISKKELETIFDAINEMICIVDKDHTILRVNKGYATYVGQEIKDLLGKKCFSIFWNCSAQCSDCPSQITFSTGKAVLKKQQVRKSPDDIKYFEIKTVPVFSSDHRIMHVIEFIKDVTEEKRMIEQLIRSEKLASIGVITAGIAHEINNPLSGISGNAANLLEMPEKYGLNDKGISRVNAIFESAARATIIMKDLLHLSKKDESSNIAVDLNTLIVKTVNAIHFSGIADIEKQYHFDQSLQPVTCDPSKIDQVILNLVTNAVQSMVEKKRLSQRDQRDYRAQMVISTQLQNNNAVITITDNGVGIPNEIRSKIFDPFFSTKPTGKGTGLGLSICHRIIEEHKGKIFFECIDDLTVFSVVLPLESKSLWTI